MKASWSPTGKVGYAVCESVAMVSVLTYAILVRSGVGRF